MKKRIYAVSDCDREVALMVPMVVKTGRFLKDGNFIADSDGSIWKIAVSLGEVEL